MQHTEREREFFDEHWARVQLEDIRDPLQVPGVDSLAGRRVLICSCGSGVEPVMAANAGAIVSAFDISPVGVANALRLATHNGVTIDARVMDFHDLTYPDESFDVIYGLAILHHVNVERVAPHIWRCLAPGGIAYFHENSDRNPMLRLARRVIFGPRGRARRSSRLGFTRHGTADEYPITEADVRALDRACHGNLVRLYPRFQFFGLLSIHGWRNPRFAAALSAIDAAIGRSAPFLRPYGFLQDLCVRKPRPHPPASLT